MPPGLGNDLTRSNIPKTRLLKSIESWKRILNIKGEEYWILGEYWEKGISLEKIENANVCCVCWFYWILLSIWSQSQQALPPLLGSPLPETVASWPFQQKAKLEMKMENPLISGWRVRKNTMKAIERSKFPAVILETKLTAITAITRASGICGTPLPPSRPHQRFKTGTFQTVSDARGQKWHSRKSMGKNWKNASKYQSGLRKTSCTFRTSTKTKTQNSVLPYHPRPAGSEINHSFKRKVGTTTWFHMSMEKRSNFWQHFSLSHPVIIIISYYPYGLIKRY